MKDVSEIVGQLLTPAREASQRAYSPYSKARVGACVIDGEGNTYTGCNVENASYGLTQCAERNALAAAINAGVTRGQVEAIVIYATGFEVLAPCGACRQVMSELMSADGVVISCHSATDYKSWQVKELLPHPFVLS
jgi:cytidine deaminase